jgi:hypothetical protein
MTGKKPKKLRDKSVSVPLHPRQTTDWSPFIEPAPSRPVYYLQKSQSFPVNSLPIYPHTVVTGSHHNIWVIYLWCLVFLSLIFRIQIVFCSLFPTKRRNSDFLNCVKLTDKKMKRLFGSRQHLHAKYCSTSHDNVQPVLSDSSFIITLPSDVWQMYFKMHN